MAARRTWPDLLALLLLSAAAVAAGSTIEVCTRC